MRDMRLDVKIDERGVWIVTSPDVKGLLVVNKDPASALWMVPQAVDDLQNAANK
jgi:hypothetical protein